MRNPRAQKKNAIDLIRRKQNAPPDFASKPCARAYRAFCRTGVPSLWEHPSPPTPPAPLDPLAVDSVFVQSSQTRVGDELCAARYRKPFGRPAVLHKCFSDCDKFMTDTGVSGSMKEKKKKSAMWFCLGNGSIDNIYSHRVPA